ncbi:hypothetical protein ACHAXA_007518 [Cyclostephanos tholiformis]|uniref:Protease Do-like PDZ domain-containing protein n=1 Tax=Cyclostephanos tholiformis TaxID=382380 RepID=A0ABD3RCW9_9STRA
MDQAGGECRSAGACCEDALNVIPGCPGESGVGAAARDDSHAASRKRPHSPDEDEIPNSKRPQTKPFPSNAVDRADVSMPVDEVTVEEAASGIINLARAHFRKPNPTKYHSHPAVASIGPTTASLTHPYNAVVHLSIVKAKPSFIEPWKNMPLVTLTGTGVIISCNCSERGINEDNSIECGEEGAYSIENIHQNDGGRTKNNTVSILTNAHLVQYAKSIRAQTQSCSTSVKCTIEFISFDMDLALLNVDLDEMTSNWKHFALPLTRNLPRLGEEMTCIRYAKSESYNISGASSVQHYFDRLSIPLQSSSRHVALDIFRGTSSGYYADEDEHYMLRMKLNSSMVPSYCGGALVIDCKSNIVGIISSSSQAESTGFHSVIPNVVIDNFLNLINNPPKELNSNCSSSCSHTDGEYSAGASLDDTKDDKHCVEGESKPRVAHDSGVRNLTSGTKYIPGIPTLSVTGIQSLENKSLRNTLGLEEGAEFVDGCGVRILGVNIIHSTVENNENQSQYKEDRNWQSPMLRPDDVLLAVDGEPVRLDASVRLSPGRENERVDFRWLVSKRSAGSGVKLSVLRQGRRIELHPTLSSPKYLIPRFDEGEGEGAPSYLICGGCVFVPLTMAWIAEMIERQKTRCGNHAALTMAELGFRRYLQDQRDRDQQIIILSHVLADDVNVGYQSFENLILSSVDGKRPINISDLCNLLVKREYGRTIEFRCLHPRSERSKIVLAFDADEVKDSELRILNNYMIDAWCSNALSPGLRREAKGKAHRHGAPCCLRTLRDMRNAVREHTLVVRRSATPHNNDTDTVAATRRIMDFTEEHKMQSAPLFAGKFTDDGWTQVKTKHLSQLCACGKSTRFYCICTVGVMRCKDCFIKHCRDHTNQHECTEACPPNCEGAPKVLVEGVELVTTKKRKRNNPTQAIQSRCVICRAKTCYCCSACGTEKEVALCHVSTGRNCLPLHISEHHQNSKGQPSSDEQQRDHCVTVHDHCARVEDVENHHCEKAQDKHYRVKAEDHHHYHNLGNN